jgi:hypothetical protein
MRCRNRCLLTIVGCALGLTAASGGQEHASSEHTWDYGASRGPGHWGELKPEFAPCKNGHRQSPIDIHNAVKADLPAIEFDYKPSPLTIVDNGHTIGCGDRAVLETVQERLASDSAALWPRHSGKQVRESEKPSLVVERSSMHAMMRWSGVRVRVSMLAGAGLGRASGRCGWLGWRRSLRGCRWRRSGRRQSRPRGPCR